jgi:hypothetical protein
MRREGKRKATDTTPLGEDYIAQLALHACKSGEHCSPPAAVPLCFCIKAKRGQKEDGYASHIIITLCKHHIVRGNAWHGRQAGTMQATRLPMGRVARSL